MEPPTTQDISRALRMISATIETGYPHSEVCELAAAARKAHVSALAAQITAAAPKADRHGYVSCLSVMYAVLPSTSVEAEAVWQARKTLEAV